MKTVYERLPRKLWIGSYEFPAKIVPADDPVLEDADGMTRTGEDERGIFVSSALDPRKFLEIVKHEVTHAINWVNDIDDGIEEEELAKRHGLAWSQFFLDNPRYQTWLTSILNTIRKERSQA